MPSKGRSRKDYLPKWGRTCEIKGCDYPTQKIGKYCDKHDQVCQQTGHPLGVTIRHVTIKPLVKAALRYIKDNQSHTAINAALVSLYQLVHDRSRPRVKDLSPRSTVRDRLGRWLDKLADQGHHEIDMLATITAVYMHRELYQNDFMSDRHFNHQVVIRFLRMVRAPRRERWSEGKPIYIYDRIVVGVRESLSTTLENKVGRVCHQMARQLTKSITDKDKQ